MLLASIRFRSQPHKRAEVISAVEDLIDRMRHTPGCTSGRLLTDVDDENSMTVASEWHTVEQVEAFLQSREFHVFKGMRILLRSEPVIVLDHLRERVTRVIRSM